MSGLIAWTCLIFAVSSGLGAWVAENGGETAERDLAVAMLVAIAAGLVAFGAWMW